MEVKRFHIFVRGRVQGVGFRYFTQDIANSLRLSGWVRNTSDGRVEIEVQGNQELIDQFLQEINEGPSLSYVADLNITEVVLSSDSGEFRIRH